MKIQIRDSATLTLSMRCASPACSHVYALRDEPDITEEASPYAAPLRAGWRFEGGLRCPDHASDRVERAAHVERERARELGGRS